MSLAGCEKASQTPTESEPCSRVYAADTQPLLRPPRDGRFTSTAGAHEAEGTVKFFTSQTMAKKLATG